MPDRFPANLAGETAGKIFEHLVPEHYHPGMTVALPPGEADREIGLLVPVAAGGFADPQQVFARDREAADQGGSMSRKVSSRMRSVSMCLRPVAIDSAVVLLSCTR